MEKTPISFGDNVRIKSTAVTQKLNFAGLTGQVLGHTTPSVTGVDVIGNPESDFAINVKFQSHDEGLWFSPDLLEFLDHAPGTT